MYCNTSTGAHDAFAFPSCRATPVPRRMGQCGTVHKSAPGRPPKLDASDLANLVRRMRTKPGRRSAVPRAVDGPDECDEDMADCRAIAKVTQCPCTITI
ncbi:hypothetical protein NP493_136g01033 [Ridgeia piscesae]|uniref:Uncharacterized protein n=1 Tax=Ridgeia piscesae TaxID=27915 RepID=A0AAD9P555_RIDPI|nr:hypothetical protein NP493_136g01033 [Ridgeia piscesae]